MQLRAGHRHLELLDQVEGEVAGEAGHVEVLGEHQQAQHDQRRDHPPAGNAVGRLHCLARLGLVEVLLVPATQHQGDAEEEQRSQAEPGHVALAERNDNGRCQQRAQRRAGVAADLEGRLGQAEAPARGQARNTRGFRVEGRRADPHQCRGQQDHGEAADEGQHHDTHQGTQGTQRQQVRRRSAIGEEADPRLQQRGGDLERQGNHADLGETQVVVGLEHRVDRRQHRLDQVIDQVRQGAETDNAHHQRGGLACRRTGGRRGGATDSHVPESPSAVWDPIIGKQIDT